MFHGLGKIHICFEKFPPLRPIVLGKNCISANLSEYVCSFLKYQAKTCKPHVRDVLGDILDFVLKIKSLSFVPSTSILVTLDVTSV